MFFNRGFWDGGLEFTLPGTGPGVVVTGDQNILAGLFSTQTTGKGGGVKVGVGRRHQGVDPGELVHELPGDVSRPGIEIRPVSRRSLRRKGFDCDRREDAYTRFVHRPGIPAVTGGNPVVFIRNGPNPQNSLASTRQQSLGEGVATLIVVGDDPVISR